MSQSEVKSKTNTVPVIFTKGDLAKLHKPGVEEEIYFTSIREAIEWLGFSPYKITYFSDYFDNFYELAIELIKCDKAYACSCTSNEMKQM
nr:5390_t:CDS:2 [Entrophospora candida]CAG8538549.1 15601_t:CDS:2 [Entrophospora candida]